MCNNAFPATPVQVIEGQYLDQQKLMALLKNVYGTSEEGKNNFRVEVNHLIPSLWALPDIANTAQAQPVQDIPLRECS
jgi:hypothetical protein